MCILRLERSWHKGVAAHGNKDVDTGWTALVEQLQVWQAELVSAAGGSPCSAQGTLINQQQTPSSLAFSCDAHLSLHYTSWGMCLKNSSHVAILQVPLKRSKGSNGWQSMVFMPHNNSEHAAGVCHLNQGCQTCTLHMHTYMPAGLHGMLMKMHPHGCLCCCACFRTAPNGT